MENEYHGQELVPIELSNGLVVWMQPDPPDTRKKVGLLARINDAVFAFLLWLLVVLTVLLGVVLVAMYA